MDNSGPCVVDTVFCSPSDLGLSPTIVTELITASSEGLLSLPPFPTALGCFLLPQLNYGYQSLVEGSDNRGPKLKRCLRHGDGPRGTRGWVLAPGAQLLGALGALLSRRVPPSVCVFRYHARIRSAPPPKNRALFTVMPRACWWGRQGGRNTGQTPDTQTTPPGKLVLSDDAWMNGSSRNRMSWGADTRVSTFRNE